MINKFESRKSKFVLVLLVIFIIVVTSIILTNSPKDGYTIVIIFEELVDVKKNGQNDEEVSVRYRVTENTIIKDRKGNPLSLADLKVGQIIDVTDVDSPFGFLASPPLIGAKEIIVIR